MAVLDFPDSPAVGDVYGSTDTKWRWDGSIWTSTVGASGPRGRVAYAKVENNQGSITALVNLAGMSVSFTADPTRTYRTTIRGEVTPAVAGDLPVAEIRDASGTTKQRWTSPLPTVNAVSMHLEVVESGLSGPQTRYATLVKAAGTGSLTFGATPSFPAFILVEDITYEAGTSGVGFEPTAWIPLTLTNSWVNYGGIQQPVQYRKTGDMVHVRGQIKSGATQTVAFQLPVGFRPPYNCNYPLANWNGSAVVNGMAVVATTGDFVPYVTSNTDVSFHIQFSTTP